MMMTPAEIAKVRQGLGLSQREFAEVFGVSLSAIRHWEQGLRTPTGAAHSLLRVIVFAPKVVMRALGHETKSGRGRR